MSSMYDLPTEGCRLFDDTIDFGEEEDVDRMSDEPYWVKSPTSQIIPPVGHDVKHWSEDPHPSSSEGIHGAMPDGEAGKTAQVEGWLGTSSLAWACIGVCDVAGVPLLLFVYRLIDANWAYLEQGIISTGISIFSLTLERELIALPAMAAIAYLVFKYQDLRKNSLGKHRVQYEQLGGCGVLALLPAIGFLMFGATIGEISATLYLGVAWTRLIDLSLPLLTVYLGYLAGMETISLPKMIALVIATGGAVFTLVFFNLGAGNHDSTSSTPEPWSSPMWWAGLLIMIPSLVCNSLLFISIGVVLRGQKRIRSTTWMVKETPRVAFISKFIRIPAVLTCSTYFQVTFYTLLTCSLLHKFSWKDFGLHGDVSAWFNLIFGSLATCLGWNTIVWAIGDVGPAMVAATACIEPFAGSILGLFHNKGGHVSTWEWMPGIITTIALAVLCAIYYFEERATQREFKKHVDIRKPLIKNIEKSASEDDFTFGEI